MENITVPDIGVAVLTGGLSSRMGTDKAVLPVAAGAGAPAFFEKICRSMSSFSGRYLSENTAQSYSFPGFSVLRDEYPGTGPMGGILTVLGHAVQDCVLFIACDMPDYPEAEARRICGLYRGEAALIPVADGKWQPLAALYSRKMIPLFREAIRRGNYRLRDAVMQADFRLAAVPQELAGCYLNINTPGDFGKYRNRAGFRYPDPGAVIPGSAGPQEFLHFENIFSVASEC